MQKMTILVDARARALDLNASRMVTRSSSRWTSFDEIEEMADVIVRRCEATIEWTNAKVAVLPFTLLGRPNRPEAGKLLADAVAQRLAASHPDAIVDREAADAVLARYKLTPLGVEYDPTVLTGKANWTHIVTGTLSFRAGSAF